MKNFADSKYLKETVDIINLMYKSGWDERNGGNLSYMLTEDEVREYVPETGRKIEMSFHVPELAGRYFLVTGTGKFFKNVIKSPEENLGLMKVDKGGKSISVMWGYVDGCCPTSELSSHFMGHISRLAADPSHRVVMHCHPANIIALSYILPQNERIMTRALWQMISECVILFPDGIGIVPWMPPGALKLGEATADKMKDFRLVFWPQHGIFATESNLDNAFGLIEAVEKAAEIYIKIYSCIGKPAENITVKDFEEVAKIYNLNIKKDFLY